MTSTFRPQRGAARPTIAAALSACIAIGAIAGPAPAQTQVGTTDGAGRRASRPAPSFELTDMDTGVTIDNRAVAGRWVLVDFWATWCGPCVAAVPYLERARAAFAGYGFEILSISFDDNAATVARFRERRSEMPWIHAIPDGGFSSDVARAFGVRGIPAYFLLAPDGTIAASGSALHGANLQATLERYLFRPGSR